MPPATPHPVARAGADLRLLRAAVFTAVCVALSAAGHVSASGDALPWWSVGLGLLVVLAIAVPCAGRERSLPAITAALALGQIGLHVVFGLGQHAAAPGPSSDASVMATAAHLVCGGGAASMGPEQARRIVDAAGLPAGHVHAAGEVSTTALLSMPMLLGHLLAAIAAGWLLRHGDRALFRLAALPAARTVAEAAPARSLRAALALVRALCAGLPAAGLPGPAAPRAADDDGPRLRTTALLHSVIRRGPPAGSGVLAAC
ncbi:hypothetical protein [Streptomyces sp. NPDC060194]|uniref:hypothetical protein n=1 Tax=Streptomyces sp. NPDC060194 TaxID=3347069 RepID=UPI003651CEDB